MPTHLLTALSLLLLSGNFLQARPITFEDLYSIPRVSEPQISPHGDRIVFVLTETDPITGESASQLWMMNADGSSLRQLTFDPEGAWHPRWSPGGDMLAFHSRRSGKEQIWLLPLTGGEAKPLTLFSTGASDCMWSPGDEHLLFVSRVFPDCPNDDCNRDRLEKSREAPVKARLFEKLFFRHYSRWDDGRVQRLFLADKSGGSAARIVYDTRHDVPTAHLGGYPDYAFSPDGRDICFVMSVDSAPAVRVNNDIYVLTIGDSVPRRLTEYEGIETSPLYSPDGAYLAYLRKERPGYESDQNELCLYDRKAGLHRSLTTAFDRSVWPYAWSPDSRFIYFLAINRGYSMVYRVRVSDARVDTLLDDAVYSNLRISPDGRWLVLGRSLSDEPYELYCYDIDQDRLSVLTTFTHDIVQELDLVRAEEFWFEGFNGDSIHGFLTRPPMFDPGRKYPLVLLIHGGPQWCWLGDFNYYGWNTQLVAAQGYVVAQIDPHGSLGYGLAFKEYISGNWGKGDYEDLIKGIDFVVREYPFVDSVRIAAMGRSYGGYMANWICGHTDRFRCLVSVDGPFEHVSKYGSTDELWFPEWEFQGTPWTNPEEYHRSSPATYAANFNTPTMVVHGQYDYRVDLSQGLAMFTALQRQGVPSQLLYYPDEGHNARDVANLRFTYQKQFEWLARWLQESSANDSDRQND